MKDIAKLAARLEVDIARAQLEEDLAWREPKHKRRPRCSARNVSTGVQCSARATKGSLCQFHAKMVKYR